MLDVSSLKEERVWRAYESSYWWEWGIQSFPDVPAQRVYEWGVHEPINVIVSNRSSPDVLRETGFVAYTRSLGFWQECASLHLGDAQYANLGDGNDDERGDGYGYLPELFEMRESWFPFVGSCLESVIGQYS